MGKIDDVTKEYMRDSRRFADLFNYHIYNGKQKIQPENLQDRDTAEIVSLYKDNKSIFSKQDFRDVLKNCILMSDDKVDYLLLGLENQSKVHYAMPVKNLVYDAINYSAQVSETAKRHRENKDVKGAEFLSGFTKEDKIVPVVTLTLLWDSVEWDGPKSLQEMYSVQDEELLKFLPNAPVNLVVPGNIQDFEKFQSELGPVLELIAKKNDVSELEELLKKNKKWYSHVDRESAKVLSVCLGTKLECENSDKEGGVDVCKAIEDLKAKAASEAEERVREEAEAHMNEVIEIERKETAISLFQDNVPIAVIAKSIKTTVDVINSWLLGAGLIEK